MVCYSWELIRWIENIRLSNGGKIQKQEPQMTIQTDVFTKGLGVHCKGISTGVNGQKRTGKPLKCLRNNACKICNTDFYKKYLKFNYSYSDGQQSCPIVSFKN